MILLHHHRLLKRIKISHKKTYSTGFHYFSTNVGNNPRLPLTTIPQGNLTHKCNCFLVKCSSPSCEGDLVCFMVIGFLSTSFRSYLQLLFSLSATMTAMMAIRTTRMTRRMVVTVHWDSSSGVGGTGSGWISVPLML